MKPNTLALLAATLLTVVFTGCYSTAEGHYKIGNPVSRDTIEGRYERPVEQIYDAAREVLKLLGTLRTDDAVTKMLVAKIDTRTVWVVVDEVAPNITRVRVQVRTRTGGGDVELAAEIEKQIALGLK